MEFELYEPDGPVLSEYFWDRGRVIIIQGPIESGTSTASAHRIWRLACEQEADHDGVRRSRWIILRNTYKQIRTATLKTWLTWFPEDQWGLLQRSEPMVHHLKRPHPNGDGTVVDCEVIFLAVDGSDVAEATLASFEITGAWINEVQFVEKPVMIELLSRTGRFPSRKGGNPGATWHGVFCDMNAPKEGHWVPYMRGDIPIPPELLEEDGNQYVKPDNWRFLLQPPGLIERVENGRFVYEPNPRAENQKWMKVPYIEKIGGWDREKIRQRIMNKIGVRRDGKPVYPTFSEEAHVSPVDIDPIPGLKLIVGLDFGRQPAAVVCQCPFDKWRVLGEIFGTNESAQIFAPRLKRYLAQNFSGYEVEFYGDPRGSDGTQSVETTAYDIFASNGMVVFPATTDNSPEMRQSAVDAVLNRRDGLLVSPNRARLLRQGLAGGYYFKKNSTIDGITKEKPEKNRYSHIVEAFENAVLGGGEGDTIVARPQNRRAIASPARRHHVSLRRSA